MQEVLSYFCVFNKEGVIVRIKYNESLLKSMAYFERITGTKLKDLVVNESFHLFIVERGNIGKAVGRNGSNVAKLEKSLNRKIKIVEFNSDLLLFIRNLIYPLTASEITQEGKIVTITGPDTNTKGLIIGRNARNLRHYEAVAKRYFDIDEIKVV